MNRPVRQSLVLLLTLAILTSIATAQIPRRKVILSLVVDRSGSMVSDGGARALQFAVPAFVRLFNNSLDEVALISFADNSQINVPIGYNFTTPIDYSVEAMLFTGGTFGTGAGNQPILSTTVGPPMSLADLQNNSVVINPGQRVVKVMVYFTDGLMNTIHYGDGSIVSPS